MTAKIEKMTDAELLEACAKAAAAGDDDRLYELDAESIRREAAADVYGLGTEQAASTR